MWDKQSVMKKYLIWTSVLAIFLLSCHGRFRRVEGNGVLAKETRHLNNFERVEARGSMDVTVQQGDRFEVSIEAEENILPLIKTRISGNELIIEMEHNISISSHEKMTVHVTAPKYKELTVAGSGNINTEDKLSNTEKVSFTTAGSGDIKAEVDAPEVDCKIAGSGNITVSGSTRDQDISIAGNGDINNLDLKTENTKIKIAGSGNARVHASVKLDVEIMGSGDIFYRGTPTITQKVMGSGDVKKVD